MAKWKASNKSAEKSKEKIIPAHVGIFFNDESVVAIECACIRVREFENGDKIIKPFTVRVNVNELENPVDKAHIEKLDRCIEKITGDAIEKLV